METRISFSYFSAAPLHPSAGSTVYFQPFAGRTHEMFRQTFREPGWRVGITEHGNSQTPQWYNVSGIIVYYELSLREQIELGASSNILLKKFVRALRIAGKDIYRQLLPLPGTFYLCAPVRHGKQNGLPSASRERVSPEPVETSIRLGKQTPGVRFSWWCTTSTRQLQSSPYSDFDFSEPRRSSEWFRQLN